MLKRIAVCIVLVLSTFPLWAGDSASFADLGFSVDGSRYMFGQYGVSSDTLRPWADIFIVDVPRNAWVPGGRQSWSPNNAITAGQDGSGALNSLIARNAKRASDHGIDHTRQGQLLYLSIEDGEARTRGESRIDFRNFDDGSLYEARLVPWVEGSGATVQSSFFIDLTRTARDGSKIRYTVGTPSLKRRGISAYRIRQVMSAPGNGALVFVIEQWHEGPSRIRYMVETLSIKK